MSKKIILTINFEETPLFLSINPTEKSELVNRFFTKVPIVQTWTDEEIFLGKDRAFSYLDSITLTLMLKSSDEPKKALSSWCFLVIPYNKLIKHDSLTIKNQDNSIILNGEIKAKIGVKDALYPDIIALKERLQFNNVFFRVENSGDILEFNKYGDNWDLESKEKKEFNQDLNDLYLIHRPKISVSTK